MNEIQPDRREQMFQFALSDQFLPLTYQGPALEPFLKLPEENISPRTVNPQKERDVRGQAPSSAPTRLAPLGLPHPRDPWQRDESRRPSPPRQTRSSQRHTKAQR